MKEKNFSKKGKQTDEIVMIHQSKLKPFEEQPYKVLMDESMDELVKSIKTNGILSPITVRKINGGQYEIIRSQTCYSRKNGKDS